MVLMIALGAYVSLAAQPDIQRQAHYGKVVVDDRRPPAFVLIDRINREYDQRIWRVRRDPFLSHHRKMRIIRKLEMERDYKILRVRESYRFDRNRRQRGRDWDRNGNRSWDRDRNEDRNWDRNSDGDRSRRYDDDRK